MTDLSICSGRGNGFERPVRGSLKIKKPSDSGKTENEGIRAPRNPVPGAGLILLLDGEVAGNVSGPTSIAKLMS
jgi:hypothetical protein